MNLFLSSDADEYIILLINSISMSRFDNFIKAIDKKEDWIEELCCCYFEKESNKEYYGFETFDGNTYKLSYEKFIEYVKLAIIRYYLGNKSDEMKKSLKATIKNTIFETVLDNIDLSLAIDIPLIYGK